MKLLKWIAIGGLVLIVAIGVAIYFGFNALKDTVPVVTGQVNTFEDCVKAGNPVSESYPVQCRTNDGQTFTQDIGNELEFSDLIRVNNPRPNQTVSSPLEITGEARGPWYFEANFSVELLDENNQSLGTAIAQAQGEWMTEDFVPFTTRLDFEEPTTETGTLVIRNANPSGLPENEKVLRMPVVFSN